MANGFIEADLAGSVAKFTQNEPGRALLTHEVLADVDAGRVIDHQAVQAWADSLNTAQPLPVPR